jgi:hypothetical protein
LGFPRTPFLTVAENLPLYRQSQTARPFGRAVFSLRLFSKPLPRGKGVRPVRSSMVGDLLCRIVVETPVNLNSRQRELLKELQASLDGDGHAASPKKKSFFDRLFD